MKQITKFFALAILMLAFAASTYAQTASAIATATIVTPIAISKTVDMNFGNIVAGVGGTVVLSPAGIRTPTGVTFLPTQPGTVTAASFNVTGEGTLTYAITLPVANYTITRISGAETMIVNTFTSTPSGAGAFRSIT